MHSYYARINTVFFSAVYALAGVGVFYGILTASSPFKGEIIRFDNVTVDEIMADRKEHFVFPYISLNLAYDFSKDWNYNTRSIYVYVAVYFEGDKETHDMIMWDKVIMSKDDCKFDETIENKYVLFNDDKNIYGKEMTVSLRYQIQPTVGLLADHTFPLVHKIQTPDS